MVYSAASRQARGPQRVERRLQTEAAVAELAAAGLAAAGLAADQARRAGAVIAHLCSSASWIAIADAAGMPDTEVRQAVVWAIDTLLAALRAEAAMNPSAAATTTTRRGRTR